MTKEVVLNNEWTDRDFREPLAAIRRILDETFPSPGNAALKSDADLLERAFGLLCCAADVGNRGEFACPGWPEAWAKFRDDYHEWLSGYVAASAAVPSETPGANNA